MTNFMVKSGSGTGSGRISQKQIRYSPSWNIPYQSVATHWNRNRGQIAQEWIVSSCGNSTVLDISTLYWDSQIANELQSCNVW